ncbi:hypothetical protein M8J76_000395 [Diaphorina citri]|nr:hypothetical protein M8J76_000395 [Diaphorina citri]
MSSLLEEGELEDGHRAPTSEVGYESQPQPPYSPQPPSRASYYSYGPEDGRYRNIRTEEFNTQERSLGHSSSNVLGDNTRTPSNQQLHDLLQNLAMCLPSNSSRDSTLPDPKRSKFSDRSLSSRPYCQHCRIPGHSIQDCRRKRSQVPSPHTSSSRRSAPSPWTLDKGPFMWTIPN